MLIPPFTLQAAAQRSPSATVEAILATHAKMTRFEAKVVRKGAPTATLARDGERVLLRLPQPKGNLLPTVRTFLSTPTKAWAYDEALNELLPLKPAGKTPAERIAAALPGRDDALTLLLDGSSLAAFLRPLAKLPGAKVGKSMVTAKGTTVSFDPWTRRLTGFASKGAGVRYVYGSFGLSSFAPKGARQVQAFTDLSGAIAKAGAGTMPVVARLVRKNARLTECDVRVLTEAGEYRVQTSGERLRQTGPKLDLGYDGKTLTVVERSSGKCYRGVARKTELRRIAAKLGEPLLPLAASFLVHALPFQNLFFPPREASLGGRVGSGPQAGDILTLKTTGTRETAFVRGDGLVMSLEAEVRDEVGTVALSRQRFVYRDPAWLRGGRLAWPSVSGPVLPLPKIGK